MDVKKNCGYQTGSVFEIIDEPVRIEDEEVGVGNPEQTRVSLRFAISKWKQHF